jgi:thymidylate synthase
MLQEVAARLLGTELGTYRHFVGSMHLYDKDQPAVQKYLDEGFQRQVEMPPMPEGDPWPSIQQMLDAEQMVRAGKPIDLSTSGLGPYWADLVRLLQVHFAEGDEARLDAIRAEFVHSGYRTFVDSKRGKPLRTAQEAR